MEDIIIEDYGWYKIKYNPVELFVYLEIEYNTDTSVRHLKVSDDIVQTVSNKEDTES